MTTATRRAVIHVVQLRYRVSERTAFRMLGFERTALRYVPQRDAAPCDALRSLASTYARWGVPRLNGKLQRHGWYVSYKHVERLYRLVTIGRASTTSEAAHRAAQAPPSRGSAERHVGYRHRQRSARVGTSRSVLQRRGFLHA